MTTKAPEEMKHLPSITAMIPVKEANPNYYGIPWSGALPDRKNSDPDPQINLNTYIAIFDLSLEPHLAYYNAVWQQISNGVAILSREELEHDKEKKNWRVYMRWAVQSAHAVADKGV